MAKSILLIHDAWVTPVYWELFRSRLEAFGFSTRAPAWPGMDRSIAELRTCASPQLSTLTVPTIARHLAAVVRHMSEPPLLVGHGFGGLIVQQLLDRGHGAAGVAVAPVCARGVWPLAVSLKSALSLLASWRCRQGLLRLSREAFEERLAHTLTPDEMDTAYESHVVPAPRRIILQTAFGIGNRVNFENHRRPPLLLVAGQEDRLVPPAMVKATWQKYVRAGVETEFRVLPGRTHWLLNSPGWQEIADAVMAWAGKTMR